jgi:predicted nucleotidyltransferase
VREVLVRDDPRLQGLIRQIVDRFDPLEIRLFGSRVRGDWHEDSDYDLLIVVADDFPEERARASAVYRAVDTSRAAADLMVIHRGAFEADRDEVGTLSYMAAHEGAVVHERAHGA